MNKKVILSVNDNPTYLYSIPLVCWAWKKLGWSPVIFYHGKFGILNELVDSLLGDIDGITGYVLHVEGYESAMITQVSRLYAASVMNADDYLMTSDADMLPLSDYWKFDESEITVWGWDLAGFHHYPICYVGMPRSRWIEVMSIDSNNYDSLIKRDLDNFPQAKSEDATLRWTVDQQLLMERINATQFKKNIVNRGVKSNGYAMGRADRSAWFYNLPGELIDAHLFRPQFNTAWVANPKFEATMRLLREVWPEHNFQWFKDYSYQFDQIVNAK